MRTVAILAVLIALAAALVTFILFGGNATPPDYEALPTPSKEHTPDPAPMPEYMKGARALRPQAGGVYAGRVLTRSDTPIEGATVLLVEYSTGLLKGGPAGLDPDEESDDSINPYGVALVGNNGIAAETRSDGDGHFTLAADAGQMISHVVAFHDGYFLQVLDVRGDETSKHGRDDLLFHLQEGGRVKGRVVDDESGAPVADALVEVNLQSITVPPIDTPEEGEHVGTRTWTPEMRPRFSQIPQLVQFIAKHLGERVWGIRYEGGSSLRLYTDKQGRFEIGPLGDEVQLEFVVTHPEYAWTDMDRPDGGSKAPRRLIVTPGKTAHRELRLKKGGEISGKVIDGDGRGVAGVEIHARSIVATPRHTYYVNGRPRKAITGSDGSFRVAGLATEVHNLEARHPAIGILHEYAVKPGTDDLVMVAERKSALVARLKGGARRHAGGPVRVHMTQRDENGHVLARSLRRAVLRADQTFALSEISPGSYEAWCTVESESSQPVTFDVKPMGTAAVEFDMEGGGSFILPLDGDGAHVVDPAMAKLIRLAPAKTGNATPPGPESELGNFLSREGMIDARGVAPGRYKLRVSAVGFVTAESPPFVVEAGEHTELSALILKRFAKLRFAGFVTADGRRPKGMVILEMKVGTGEFKRVQGLSRDGEIEVPPGPIEVRAYVVGTNWKAADKERVNSGEVKAIQIVFKEGG